ncbi:MAG: hypothetical protein ACXW5U_11795 [Thermoanaerobaculia bacterium]
MLPKTGRILGGAIGLVLLGSALMRALFDAYGHVGQFLGILPPPVAKFIGSPNGTVFLVVVGLVFLWWAVRAQRISDQDAARSHEESERLRSEIDRLQAEIVGIRAGASANDWQVSFFGQVEDIRIFEDRHAIAVDVVVTNRSQTRISLTARLFVEWSRHAIEPGAEARQTPIPRWDKALRVFRIAPQRQLVFPLNLDRGVESGHIVFDIPSEGLGVRWLQHMDGAEEEGERFDRRCHVRFEDRITGVQHDVPVFVVGAPQLDGLRLRSDLAVYGRAATWLPDDL